MISLGAAVSVMRGEAAQVGEPQDRLDAVGDAALDAALQHALAGVAAEIDLDQGAGDRGQRRRS